MKKDIDNSYIAEASTDFFHHAVLMAVFMLISCLKPETVKMNFYADFNALIAVKITM